MFLRNLQIYWKIYLNIQGSGSMNEKEGIDFKKYIQGIKLRCGDLIRCDERGRGKKFGSLGDSVSGVDIKWVKNQ